MQLPCFERRPELLVEVMSNNRVLDIREKVGKLDILFDGKSLQAQKLDLRLVTVRISNIGTADIAKNAFDEKALFGLEILGGEIVEGPELQSPIPYLMENAKIHMPSAGRLLLSPVILDSKDWLELKLLLLVREGSELDFRPIGKIAGARTTRLELVYKSALSESHWDKATKGDYLIQLIRIPIYLLCSIVLLFAALFAVLLFVVPASMFSERRNKMRRSKLFEEYVSMRNINDEDRKVLKTFLESPYALATLKSVLQLSPAPDKRVESEITSRDRYPEDRHAEMLHRNHVLAKLELASEKDGKLIVCDGIGKAALQLFTFLDSKDFKL